MPQLEMARMKWEDGNGRKHVQHIVRHMGSNNGFGVLDVLRNVVVDMGYSTRLDAWKALYEYEEKLLKE